jgi:GPI inositol-deacylase
MRRRPSGSATEEEDDAPKSDPLLASGHGDKVNTSLTELRRILKEEGNTTARRKRDGATSPTAASAKSQAWVSPHQTGRPSEKDAGSMKLLAKDISADSMVEDVPRRRTPWRNPWSCSLLTLATTAIAAVLFYTIVHSFLKLQLDPKGCAMCYMRPSFVRYSDFDTEHTRFASKYALYLYREGVIDENPKVSKSQTCIKMRRF